MGANDEYPPEVRAIVSTIESWLDKNDNKIDLDLSQDPIDFKQLAPALFIGTKAKVRITLIFTNENSIKDASLDQLRSSIDRVALDKLPLPGLDGIPPQWEVHPQTRWSSFPEGITLNHYDPNTHILKFTVQTNFFAICGYIPQVPSILDAPAPKGTHLQVRRDIQGVIKIAARLIFEQSTSNTSI